MKTNKDLQESLEGLANELKQKNNEIKKLRASSVNVKREMEIETVAMETKVDDVRKEFDAEMKEVKKHHKKEISKVRALSSIYISISGARTQVQKVKLIRRYCTSVSVPF
jgi:phenylalanyl-tRNA synthetase alpha subunit